MRALPAAPGGARRGAWGAGEVPGVRGVAVASHVLAMMLACAVATAGENVELTRSDPPEGAFTSATLSVDGYRLGGDGGKGNDLGIVETKRGLTLHVDERGVIQTIEVAPAFSKLHFHDGRFRDLLQDFSTYRMRALLGVEDPPANPVIGGLGPSTEGPYRYARLGVSFVANEGKATLMLFPAAAKR